MPDRQSGWRTCWDTSAALDGARYRSDIEDNRHFRHVWHRRSDLVTGWGSAYADGKVWWMRAPSTS